MKFVILGPPEATSSQLWNDAQNQKCVYKQFWKISRVRRDFKFGGSTITKTDFWKIYNEVSYVNLIKKVKFMILGPPKATSSQLHKHAQTQKYLYNWIWKIPRVRKGFHFGGSLDTTIFWCGGLLDLHRRLLLNWWRIKSQRRSAGK